jgi:hypothetical protein
VAPAPAQGHSETHVAHLVVAQREDAEV